MPAWRLPQPAIRFEKFELDTRAGELTKRGVRVKLQEQPFQLLQVLLEHPGEVVTREELRQRLWPSDTFVDFEHGLYNAIKRVREALGDSAEQPRFVETISKRGYRFIADVETAEAGRSAATATVASDSIAVLPFANLSPDAENEFFADGIAEEIINALAQIEGLHVVAVARHSPLNENTLTRGLSVSSWVCEPSLRGASGERTTGCALRRS